MGETKNVHFYDFGTFRRVLGSQNQMCSSLETPGHFKRINKIPTDFEIRTFETSQHGGNAKVRQSLKTTDAAKTPDDAFNLILKILDIRSISSRNIPTPRHTDSHPRNPIISYSITSVDGYYYFMFHDFSSKNKQHLSLRLFQCFLCHQYSLFA